MIMIKVAQPKTVFLFIPIVWYFFEATNIAIFKILSASDNRNLVQKDGLCADQQEIARWFVKGHQRRVNGCAEQIRYKILKAVWR